MEISELLKIISSRIIFKFGMKVHYGKAKTPIVFWCGRSHRCHGNIFGGNILELVTSAVFTRLSRNLAHRTDITWRCEKWNFRNCYAKRCHGNHTSGKIISFSFSFCSFYPIGMKFGTQDRYNMALWKIEFSELLSVAMATTHIGKNNFIFL